MSRQELIAGDSLEFINSNPNIYLTFLKDGETNVYEYSTLKIDDTSAKKRYFISMSNGVNVLIKLIDRRYYFTVEKTKDNPSHKLHLSTNLVKPDIRLLPFRSQVYLIGIDDVRGYDTGDPFFRFGISSYFSVNLLFDSNILSIEAVKR